MNKNETERKLAKREDRPSRFGFWFDPFADFDRWFDDPFFFPAGRRMAMRPHVNVGVPSVDISDEGDHIRIKADMPGVPKENVEVEVDDDVLEIKARTDESHEATDGNYIRRERRTSSFHRCFSLPDTVRSDEIKATMKDGVLSITVPKVEPKQPKKVSVDVD
jgi:HSP20 family protein